MTGFQESDPTVEGWRVEAFQMATSGARVRKPSSFRVARDAGRARSDTSPKATSWEPGGAMGIYTVQNYLHSIRSLLR
jgi:hypothetical protein